MISFVAGCRPNFVKMAPLCREFIKRDLKFLFCHTGQHYDFLMSRSFLETLNLPEPDFYGIENIPADTEVIIVFGDVNSSREAAEYAFAKGIKIIHIEAGLRSFDETMPEEINRIIIDKLSSYLFVTEESGVTNLRNEGITNNVYLIGNVMIDTLEYFHPRFILLTLHRPSNVDDTEKLNNILETINSIGIEVMYPVHPRVNLGKTFSNIYFIDPLPYDQFVQKMLMSSLIITDSGGIQEEAAYLGRKCLTLRNNTERPITLLYGNELIELQNLKHRVEYLMNIPHWDGLASKRIVDIIETACIHAL